MTQSSLQSGIYRRYSVNIPLLNLYEQNEGMCNAITVPNFVDFAISNIFALLDYHSHYKHSPYKRGHLDFLKSMYIGKRCYEILVRFFFFFIFFC